METNQTVGTKQECEQITEHMVNPANDRIKVQVIDGPGAGNACHHYIAGVNCPGEEGHWVHEIKFQNGPIAEAGVNGTTHEVLLAILAHRLRGFQAGQFGCAENAEALAHIEAAQAALQKRTSARMDRGVEGTHEV